MTFHRRLHEALATAGSGIGTPPAMRSDDGDDDPWEPTPEQLQRVWQWVAANHKVLTPVVLGTLGATEPTWEPGRQEMDPPGGPRSSVAGTITIRAYWTMTPQNPAWPAFQQQLRQTLLRSDLWKLLGVEYREASRALDSEPLMQALLRAFQFELNNHNAAAFWLYEQRPAALEYATTIAQHMLQHQPLTPGYGRGGEHAVVPGSLKVVIRSPKPRNVMQNYIPKGRVGAGGGIIPDTALIMAAELDFGFSASIDLYGPYADDGAFSQLPQSDRFEVLYGIEAALEGVWKELRQHLEIDLNRSRGSFDPIVDPDRYVGVIADWQPYFEDMELDPPTFANALGSIPPRLLGMISQDFNCARNVHRRSDDDWVDEARAVLTPIRATLTARGLELEVKVEFDYR